MSEHGMRAGLSANLSAAALAIVFALTAAVYVDQANAFNTLRGASSSYLLASLKGRESGTRETLSIPSNNVLQVALQTQPLNPVSVNAALFAETARNPDKSPSGAKVAMLDRLGWRNTTALQNRIFYAVANNDLDQIVRIADALLRREELIREGHALMNLMELSPPTRSQLVDTLAREPSWRAGYFQSPLQPKGSLAIQARAALAEGLYQRSKPLSRGELYPTLGLLINNGYTREGYDLWLKYRGITKPLLINDTNFWWSYQNRNDVHSELPFEWQLLTGAGFWTEFVDNDGKVSLTINWGRKGVPVFVQQQLYLGATQNGLRLRVDGTDLPSGLLDSISFVLTCPQGQVYFDKVIRKTQSRFDLASDDAIACGDPLFKITGRPMRRGASGPAPIIGVSESLSVTFTGITLQSSRR